VVESTRLSKVQEFAKCCTNTSLALVSQQSPVGMDLDQSKPSTFLAHPGRAAAWASYRDCSDCAVSASAHAPGLQPTLWIQLTRTHYGLGAPQRFRLDERGDHGGEMLALALAAVCTYCTILGTVRPLPCMVGGSWAADWRSYGDAPLQLDAFFSLAVQSS
jgi:hypothetical protein